MFSHVYLSVYIYRYTYNAYNTAKLSLRLSRLQLNMLRSVVSLPLPGSVQARLRNQGFVYCEDIYSEKGNDTLNKIMSIWKQTSIACLLVYDNEHAT
jgi:hypothetical protein